MCSLPFTLCGHIARGKQLGTKLGFPTANIRYDPTAQKWPKEGVYIGVARVQGEMRSYVAILNQGKHPTAPGGAPTVEAHLLGHPNHALYGLQITLTYHQFLRPEQAFPSLEALKEQLGRDLQCAVSWAQRNDPELLLSTPYQSEPNPLAKEPFQKYDG